MAIILGCDGCGTQSPNEHGERVADDWLTVTFQTQRQRDRANQGTRIVMCQNCAPLLGNEISLHQLGIDLPRSS